MCIVDNGMFTLLFFVSTIQKRQNLDLPNIPKSIPKLGINLMKSLIFISIDCEFQIENRMFLG